MTQRIFNNSNINPMTFSSVDGGIVDAFGRLRISAPETLFDSKNLFKDPDLLDTEENQPLFYDNVQVSGTGTSTLYNTGAAEQELFVSALTTGKRVRQTKMRFNYQPGKSQLILLTFNMNGYATGIIKREGIFDDNNGIFLKLDSTGPSICVRSSTSGSPENISIPQHEWNVDHFDGNGISQINLDWTKTQILLVDYEWLGVGRVRVGFVVDGRIWYAHAFNNANNLEVVYMSTPNLPLRSEIENDGNGEADSMTQICSTVISEGGSQDLGIIRYASTNGTHLDANVENTSYALLGIKVKSNYIGASIKPLVSALQVHTASHKLEWYLALNPTVAGTFTYVDETNSAVQIARGATTNTVTGGIQLTGGYIESGGNQTGAAGSDERSLTNAILIGSTVAGVSDVLVLCVRPIAGSTGVDIEGSITWRELT